MASVSKTRGRGPVLQSLEAVRANWQASLLLPAVGVVLVVAYHYVETAHFFLERVAGLKLRYGYAYSTMSTALFAGWIPYAVGALTPGRRPATPLREFAFLTLFWAYKGLEIDTLYRLQALAFGAGVDFGTIAKKTLVDMGLYVPLLGIPPSVAAYVWKASGFDVAVFRRRMGRHWYRERVAPALVANYAVWIPGVLLIYSLPLALQLPVQNLLLCLYVLLLAYLTRPSAVEATLTVRRPSDPCTVNR